MTAPPSARVYIIIWGWLAGLMLLGVLLSESGVLPIPTTTIVITVLALSTIKAVLVALYYMHLNVDRRVLLFVGLFPFLLILLAVGVILSSRWVRL